MRTALSLSLAVLVSGCTAEDLCSTIPPGTGIHGYRKAEVGPSSDFVIRAMQVPAEGAPFGRGTSQVWDKGPVAEAMCCASQESGRTFAWCGAEQLTCAEPALQDVKLYLLESPYSDESGAPDWATYCFVAVHEDRIIAIWHRYWS